MIDPRKYNISVRFGVFEGEECYEARIRELPDVAEYGDSFQQAYELALDAIETTAEALRQIGQKMPTPQEQEDQYSGRVTLRVPKSLHKGLAIKAEDEGVSLNHLMVSVLSAFRGFDAALEEDRNGWGAIVEPPRVHKKSERARVFQFSEYKASGW